MLLNWVSSSYEILVYILLLFQRLDFLAETQPTHFIFMYVAVEGKLSPLTLSTVFVVQLVCDDSDVRHTTEPSHDNTGLWFTVRCDHSSFKTLN